VHGDACGIWLIGAAEGGIKQGPSPLPSSTPKIESQRVQNFLAGFFEQFAKEVAGHHPLSQAIYP